MLTAIRIIPLIFIKIPVYLDIVPVCFNPEVNSASAIIITH